MKNFNSLMFTLMLLLALFALNACGGDDLVGNLTDGDSNTTDGDSSSIEGLPDEDCSDYDPDSEEMTCHSIICGHLDSIEGADDLTIKCSIDEFFPCMEDRCQDSGNNAGITAMECLQELSGCISDDLF